MDIWDAIPLVSSGLSLAAFVTASAVLAYRARLRKQRDIILSAPEGDRVRAIETAAEFFNVETKNLSREQQAQIVLVQIAARSRRDLTWAVLLFGTALIVGSIALASILNETSPTNNGSATITGSTPCGWLLPCALAQDALGPFDYALPSLGSEVQYEKSLEGTTLVVRTINPSRLLQERGLWSPFGDASGQTEVEYPEIAPADLDLALAAAETSLHTSHISVTVTKFQRDILPYFNIGGDANLGAAPLNITNLGYGKAISPIVTLNGYEDEVCAPIEKFNDAFWEGIWDVHEITEQEENARAAIYRAMDFTYSMNYIRFISGFSPSKPPLFSATVKLKDFQRDNIIALESGNPFEKWLGDGSGNGKPLCLGVIVDYKDELGKPLQQKFIGMHHYEAGAGGWTDFVGSVDLKLKSNDLGKDVVYRFATTLPKNASERYRLRVSFDLPGTYETVIKVYRVDGSVLTERKIRFEYHTPRFITDT